MKIITAGSAFIDIDAYGGMVAEAELQRLLGNESQAITTAPINESVTETVRSWRGEVLTDYVPHDNDTFTLVDVSDPSFFDPIVDLERVEVVIDHHVGYEEYWQKRIGTNTQIEFIGAACTLVYERWVTAGKLDQMSQTSARVLITGILDNTLDFRATITHERDHIAYHALMQKADLPDSWAQEYFLECQKAVESDLATAIRNDYKTLTPSDTLPQVLAQLVVWGGGQNSFLGPKKQELTAVLDGIADQWWANIISLDDGTSYFMASDQAEQGKFARLMGVTFVDGVADAGKLYLRKEILKTAQEAA